MTPPNLRAAARELQEAEITIEEFLDILKSSLDGIELPEKRPIVFPANHDVTMPDPPELVTHAKEVTAFNQAITEVETAINKFKESL